MRGEPIPRSSTEARAGRPAAAFAILAAALLLVWPAALNRYPIVFVDTAAYLLHTITGDAPWDKTAAYGPALWLFHQNVTLWAPLLAQGLLLSWLLWLVQSVAFGDARPAGHLALAALLAAFTSAPWFAATLMPDALTPVVALCCFLLGFGETKLRWPATLAVGIVATVAVATHLSHVPMALALLGLILLLRRQARPVLRAGLPVAAALAALALANWHAFGRPALSPHGAVFLFARLQADGPAVATLRDRCPGAGWYLCDFLDRMPMDSDHFLWNPASPPARDAAGNDRPRGAVLLAPEAAEVVAETLRRHPFAVLRAALANWAEQLFLVRVGDTLPNADLDEFAERVLAPGFPPREAARFEAGAQMRGTLEALAAPFIAVQLPVLLLCVLALPFAARRLRRLREPPRLALALCLIAAVFANAFATGALSKPHHRYQARIVWLLPLATLAAFWPAARRRSDDGLVEGQPQIRAHPAVLPT
jgi:hypothetical protein